MKFDEVVIYGLVNPTDAKVFYVGATTCKLSTRLSAHLTDCRHTPNNPKTKIIKNLLQQNLKPEIFEIETVVFEDAAKTEEFYISLFKFYGFLLPQLSYSTYLQTITKHKRSFISEMQNKGVQNETPITTKIVTIICPTCDAYIAQKEKISVKGVGEMECSQCKTRIWYDVEEDKILKTSAPTSAATTLSAKGKD